MSIAHRKSAAVLQFADSAGAPLANAEIGYELTDHEFLFGVGGHAALPASDPAAPDRAFFQRRVELMSAFNYATIPFYWGQFEPEEGRLQTESRMNAARLLNSKGMRTKGHPLCWHTVCADWLMEYDNKTILKKQLDRIQREVSNFRGIVDIWDVINEVVIMPVYDRYDNAVTRICREFGPVNLVKMVFDAAKQANPDAVLLINDFNLSEKYRDLIARCLDAGAPIDVIGLQSHQHQGYRGEAWFEAVLERFAPLGLPLHFTENTLVSGHLMPPEIVDLNDYQVDVWPTTPEGEQRQALEWEKMYRQLFACPQVEAVTGWNFGDDAWLHAPAGLVRTDNSIKPAYRVLTGLIHQEWTSKGTLHTDSAGRAQLEGFRGSYRFDCGARTAAWTLTKNPIDTTVIF